jgi:hypothetical protein
VGTLTSTVAAFLLTWINVAKGTNFPGQLQRPLVTDIFYFISSAIWCLASVSEWFLFLVNGFWEFGGGFEGDLDFGIFG